MCAASEGNTACRNFDLGGGALYLGSEDGAPVLVGVMYYAETDCNNLFLTKKEPVLPWVRQETQLTCKFL